MAKYHHILLALDFSPEAETVLNKALELAQLNDARLSVIHVVEYTSAMYASDSPLPNA